VGDRRIENGRIESAFQDRDVVEVNGFSAQMSM
jgi:hypothetical protein